MGKVNVAQSKINIGYEIIKQHCYTMFIRWETSTKCQKNDHVSNKTNESQTRSSVNKIHTENL